jgi:hypothetical protein
MTSMEGCAGKALVYLAFKAIKLRAATICGVLPRVEQTDPQASGPGVLDLGLRPGLPSGHLVGGNELLGLPDGSRSPRFPSRGPHGGCKANDRCFRLDDHAVPVVHGKRAPAAQAMFWDSQSP